MVGKPSGVQDSQDVQVCGPDFIDLDGASVVVIITTMGSAELIRKLEADGWLFRGAKGSHHVFVHPEKPGHVVVPHPRKDLGKGLVHQIMKAAGLK